jgi:hypothetical protein
MRMKGSVGDEAVEDMVEDLNMKPKKTPKLDV